MNKSVTIVVQLRVGGFDDNFSYLLYDVNDGTAALIDPCGDIAVIRRACENVPVKLHPAYILITHGHGDHTSGIASAKKFFPAPAAAHPQCRFPHEIMLFDRQVLSLGGNALECLYAPGHSNDSVCYRLTDDSGLFTGDTLFIDCCGYCEAGAMFNTMRTVIYPLSGSNVVWPGHDYGPTPSALLSEQKAHNPYLSITDFRLFCAALRDL